MSQWLHLERDFAASYEVEQLDRIDRSGGRRAYGFPGAVSLDAQQELAAGPILAVTPETGDPWVGVFSGGADYHTTAFASSRVFAWPGSRSFCVLYAGGAVVVRADDPRDTYEVEAVPCVTQVVLAVERGIVIFSDFTNLTAYGRDGLLWRSRRLALDDLRVESVDGDVLTVSGYFGEDGSPHFTVDLTTGQDSGRPYEVPE